MDAPEETTRQYWDNAADTFDDEPDHGLRDPAIKRAWQELLSTLLPPPPATVLDVGCGTGSLSVLLAAAGYDVTGIDFSPAMIARARNKAEAGGQAVTFAVMDAAAPQLPEQRFNVLLCRHLLWALPHPEQVLERWFSLLAPGGRLVLIEGFWQTGGGLHLAETLAAMPRHLTHFYVEDLSGQPALWGGPVTDERYAVSADLPAGVRDS